MFFLCSPELVEQTLAEARAAGWTKPDTPVKPRALRSDEPGLKPCYRCGEEKPYREFNRRAANKDGYYYICRECERREKRKW